MEVVGLHRAAEVLLQRENRRQRKLPVRILYDRRTIGVSHRQTRIVAVNAYVPRPYAFNPNTAYLLAWPGTGMKVDAWLPVLRGLACSRR